MYTRKYTSAGAVSSSSKITSDPEFFSLRANACHDYNVVAVCAAPKLEAAS